VRASVRQQAPSSDKSSSPLHSSTTTTGTTTTPNSLGNVSSGEGLGVVSKGSSASGFPRENVPSGAQEAVAHQAYMSMSPRYDVDPSAGYPSPHHGDQQHHQQQHHHHRHPHQQHQQQQQAVRYNPANYPAAIKLLVSNNVAGSIIGRQGQTISELQQQSSTRIKLSQTGDYYPATQDRVCLIQGETENVKTAIRLLLERLYMLQEHQHSQHMAWQLQIQKAGTAPTFDFVVRLLVPSASCGMIIGKSGSNIKFLEETTGVASVRLSPKETVDPSYPQAVALVAATAERMVTVTGPTLESCIQCMFLILDGMTSHPDICRYSNMTTSYSRLLQQEATPSYPANPAPAVSHPRPVLVAVPQVSPRHASPADHLWEGGGGSGVMHASSPYLTTSVGGVPRRIASSPDISNLMLSQRPEPSSQVAPDRLAGYNHSMSMHAVYSAVHLGGGQGPPPQTPQTGFPLYRMHEHYDEGRIHPPPLPPPAMTGEVSHSASAPDLLAMQLDQSMHLSPLSPPVPHHHGAPAGANSMDYLVPVAPSCIGPNQFQAQLLVPDTMIGSVLGRGGRTLTELQMISGTRIRISQRGEYLPGTRNRIVTIRGSTAQGVWQAQLMMSQRIVLPPTAAATATTVAHPGAQGGGGGPAGAAPATDLHTSSAAPPSAAAAPSSSSAPQRRQQQHVQEESAAPDSNPPT
jgi:RNA-binding protein Nova